MTDIKKYYTNDNRSSRTTELDLFSQRVKLSSARYVLSALNGKVKRSFSSLAERDAVYEQLSRGRYTSYGQFVDAVKGTPSVVEVE